LPLTGGALAKLAVKDLFGDGPAGMASQLSAAATTALMLLFLIRLARSPQDERADVSPGRVWSWLALAVAALLIPWLMFAAIGSPAEALDPAKLWDAVWPMLIGAALAGGLWVLGDFLPRIPAGDIIVAEEAAFHGLAPLGAAFERADQGVRQWPAAGVALIMIVLALAAAGYVSR
jgi:hypothetical protein